MADSPNGSMTHSMLPRKRTINPWGRFRLWQEERFKREQDDLRAYLQAATPIALRANRLYEAWREVVSEPIQDNQKAANSTATFWWRVTEGLRRFEELTPPESARKYHKLFAEAMRNASLGGETAKNGFRVGKTYEVGRGLGFLDDFLKQMDEAEKELGRLVLKYRLLEDVPIVDEGPSSEEPDQDEKYGTEWKE